jgi:hypothetical protein
LRFDGIPCEILLVSVMDVVDMGVRMVRRLMGVIVPMPLADVEPHPDSHRARGHPGHAGHRSSETRTPNGGATEK